MTGNSSRIPKTVYWFALGFPARNAFRSQVRGVAASVFDSDLLNRCPGFQRREVLRTRHAELRCVLRFATWREWGKPVIVACVVQNQNLATSWSLRF